MASPNDSVPARKGPPWIALGVGAVLLGIGLVERAVVEGPSGWNGIFYRSQVRTFVQGGALIIALAVLLTLLGFVAPRLRGMLSRFLRSTLPKLLVGVLLFGGVCELALRVVFSEGVTFSTGGGPFGRRFHKDVEPNKYGARGPEVAGAKAKGERRILFMGDSIMWGQGVKADEDVMAARVLAALKKRNENVTAAAVCHPGREIDAHLAEIRKWGAEIAPDVVVYQWFSNDCEIATPARPLPSAPWRRALCWELLSQVSFFVHMVDYQLFKFAPKPPRSYVEYMEAELKPGSPAWAAFERDFRAWAAEAKKLTPRVLVVLYPSLGPEGPQLVGIKERVIALCRDVGVESLDFQAAEPDSFVLEKTIASQFDNHPGAETHGVMARLTEKRLVELWPELFNANRD